MELERPLMYFLDEHGEPVGIDRLDALSDARMSDWYEHAWEPGPRSKRVAETTVDNWWVSTVFLSIDHQFGSGPPVLWETMIFPMKPEADNADRLHETASGRMLPDEQYSERYTSREDALQGHARVVAALLAGKTPEDVTDDALGCTA